MTMVAVERWTPTYDELASLLRWLDLTGAVYTVEDAASVVSKPWKWHREFVAMRELQDRLAAEDAA